MKGIEGHYKAKVRDSPDKIEMDMGWYQTKKHSYQQFS